MIEQMDTAMGRILQAMEDKGMRENSLVMVMGDNGGPDIASSNGDLRGGKGVAYEGGMRTPFFIQWPSCFGKLTQPLVSHRSLTIVDLYSTVLSLTPNADLSKDADSHALFNMFSTANDVLRLGESYPDDVENVPSDHGPDPFYPALSRFNSAVLHGDYKLVLSRQFNNPTVYIELFDLRKDPREQMNMLDHHYVTNVSKPKVEDLLKKLGGQMHLGEFSTEPLHASWYAERVKGYINCEEISPDVERLIRHGYVSRTTQHYLTGPILDVLGERKKCHGLASTLQQMSPSQTCSGIRVLDDWCVTHR